MEAQSQTMLRVLCPAVAVIVRTSPAVDEKIDPESRTVPTGDPSAAASQSNAGPRNPQRYATESFERRPWDVSESRFHAKYGRCVRYAGTAAQRSGPV